jgi:hypothetical protein
MLSDLGYPGECCATRVLGLSLPPDLVLCLNETREGHMMQLQVALEVNLDLQTTERGGSRKPQKSLSISFKPNPSTKNSRIQIEHLKNEQTLIEY